MFIAAQFIIAKNVKQPNIPQQVKPIKCSTFIHGIFNNQKKGTTDTFNNFDESQRHHAEWKPVSKGYILFHLCDSLRKRNYRDREQICGCQGVKSEGWVWLQKCSDEGGCWCGGTVLYPECGATRIYTCVKFIQLHTKKKKGQFYCMMIFLK